MRNRNGIEIKKCCASCRFRQISSEKGRFCKKHQKKVKAGWLCEEWGINPNLEHAGDSGGQVKCAKYLDYYRKHWLKQQEDLVAKRITADDFASVEDIRKDYEQEHGSIYINI